LSSSDDAFAAGTTALTGKAAPLARGATNWRGFNFDVELGRRLLRTGGAIPDDLGCCSCFQFKHLLLYVT
jgi:hypothetical protein